MAGELLEELSQGQIFIYQDGGLNLQVRLDGQTVWLPQRLIAELFQVSVKTANEHIVNIYSEGELSREATIRSFRRVQREGSRDVARQVDHYSLDAILAVGYRVRSARGTAFRQWATARLSELLVKGFTLDDERIKAGRTLGADYFDELLARIRDIRSEAIVTASARGWRHSHRRRPFRGCSSPRQRSRDAFEGRWPGLRRFRACADRWRRRPGW